MGATLTYAGPRDARRGAMAPERSYDQRMQALAKGNDIRTRRADLKRDLKAGRVEIAPLLVDPPWFLESMKLFDLLLAVPKIGRVKAQKLLAVAKASPSKSVGGLSPRQRSELAGLLRRGRR